MIEAIIQFFYNKTHRNSQMYIKDELPYGFMGYDKEKARKISNAIFTIPKGNLLIHYRDKNIIHDITDDRIIKL